MTALAYGKTMQGNDVFMRTIQIVDSALTPIPLNTINDYKINVYRLSDTAAKTKVYILRKTPKIGEGQVIIVSNDLGKVGFIVPRDITIKCPKGLLFAEIEVQLTAGAEYKSSLMKTGTDNYVVTQIIESSNPVEII